MKSFIANPHEYLGMTLNLKKSSVVENEDLDYLIVLSQDEL
jgi:hypothetical protein